ncbi:hypothetical protein V501_09854 [Pseudogymnoascus sp. VKM F-4519 (FW-2642)]|nr:hypothetical protein V501_09854 [Pseudogymnoascus sp. VKM F-4519 (FW-2642)]
MHAILVWILYPFLFTAALAMFFFGLSLVLPQAGFVARILVSYLALVACAIYGVTVSLIARPFGLQHSAQYATGRAFEFVMKYGAGINVIIEDPENYLNTVRPAVFIGPHQTELDILMLGAVFPTHCSVTAKASLKRIPVLGWFMALSGTVFIDRGNSKSARGAMQGAADEMKRKSQSVWMFPEGTRSYAEEPGLLPFKKGAFHLAVQAGVPIVPVVVANYSDVLFVKKYRFNGGNLRVKVLKPIETKNLTSEDVDELVINTRNTMITTMAELTAKQRGKPVHIDPKLGLSKVGVVKASGVEATMSALS